MPIRVLDSRVAAQIAAGEVVERPASIVKELVENALDAGAARISVSIRGGGIDEIVIQDDGGGIPADEIELAFNRHATSKLTSADDLWAIQTLGFRGEALPAIAAIAQVSCVSRVAAAPMGAELRIAGGEVQSHTARGCSPGTTFTIRNLFYNIPVRRAFLKSAAAEATVIAAVVSQYALAYPQVAFTLVRDGKRVVQTSGRGQLADVLLELYGVEIARQMIAVDGRAGEGIGAVHIQGMVSAPTVSRSARDGMHLTVNGRAIVARGPISAMIEQAYHTLLMKGRFPIVVLQIQVHPSAVDVNVHPTKSEVKFRQPELVGQTLGRAVRAAVQQNVVIQGWQPESGSVAAEADDDDLPASSDVSDDDASASTPVDNQRDAPGTLWVSRFQSPAQTDDDAPASTPVDNQRNALDARFQSPALAPTRNDGGFHPPFVRDMSRFTRAPQPAQIDDEQSPAAPSQLAEPEPVQAALLDQQLQYAEPPDQPPSRQLAEARWPAPAVEQAADADQDDPATDSLPAATAPQAASVRPATPALPDSARPTMHLPPLRALAQLAQTYLLTEGPNGALYLIDQHAAHERITYERLLAQHTAGELQSQTLLLPQYVALPPSAQQALLGAAGELADWGFVLTEADGGVDVLAVPADFALETLATTLPDLASHLGGNAGHGPNARRDAMLATLACHTSVRAGQTLTAIEQQALIDQLAGCEGPRTCPHGRPTLIVLTKHQLEQQFGRLGA
jgi:DNA mismatch repair protein MutL